MAQAKLPIVRILKIDPHAPDPTTLSVAATIIAGGGIVAYPTDTLYGLAVDPRDDAAVERLYRAKERDSDLAVPLIAGSLEQALASGTFTDADVRLARAFWPGPLSIVVPASAIVSARLVGPGATVAVRVPAHPVARGLALALGFRDHVDKCESIRHAGGHIGERDRCRPRRSPRCSHRRRGQSGWRAIDDRRAHTRRAAAAARRRDLVGARAKIRRVTRHTASRPTSTVSLERAALVGLISGPSRRFDPEHSLDELAGLTSAAGAEVVLRVMQERAKPDPATFLGSGKLERLSVSCDEVRADVVIFDNELSPAQLRNLEKALDRKVLDRTQLILDIFARRARTREGKLQVELAQLQYLMPRLVGSSAALSGSAVASALAAPAKRSSRLTGGASGTASA